MSTPEINDVDLTGRVMTRSEVLGYPDTPVSVGTVIAVPDELVGEMWRLLGMLPPATRRLATLQFHIERPALESVSAATAPINLDGTFDLSLPPGQYLFCLSGIIAEAAVGAMDIVGCGPCVIPPEPAFLSLSYGEGGVMLIGPP